MESEPSPSEFPSISTPNFWNFFPDSKDKQLILNHFYECLKNLTVKDVNDTVLNNIQQMFNIILEQRKYYRDQNNNSLKILKEKDDELKYEKQMNQILKDQKEDGINAINILQDENNNLENKLFKAEQALTKTKQEAEEDAKATKEAITDAFKNELNELFDLREKYEILQSNSSTEKNAKNMVTEQIRNSSSATNSEEWKAQNEFNKSLNEENKRLQNELKILQKENEIFNKRKIAFIKFTEMVKTVQGKNIITKKTKTTEKDSEITKLEEEIRQLNAKNESDKTTFQKQIDKNIALLKDKEIYAKKLKLELDETNKALQVQILLTQKEPNRLENQNEIQKERNCKSPSFQNRKRALDFGNAKSWKQKKIAASNPTLNVYPWIINQNVQQQVYRSLQQQQQSTDINCQQQVFSQPQNNHLVNPFQPYQNPSSGYPQQQQQPQFQMQTSQNGYANFQQPFNNAQINPFLQQYCNQQFPPYPSLF